MVVIFKEKKAEKYVRTPMQNGYCIKFEFTELVSVRVLLVECISVYLIYILGVVVLCRCIDLGCWVVIILRLKVNPTLCDYQGGYILYVCGCSLIVCRDLKRKMMPIILSVVLW